MFDVDGPVELSSGLLVCAAHHLELCPFCCCDYTSHNEMLGFHQTSDEDEYGSYESDNSVDSHQYGKFWKERDLLRLLDPDYESDDEIVDYSQSIQFIYPKEDGPIIGTGRVIPSKFPPLLNYTPQRLFPAGKFRVPGNNRYRNRKDVTQGLIYTDGACFNNGKPNARGGCDFVFSDPIASRFYHADFALEHTGPTGEVHPHTSNRAELRAVIAALRFREWGGEGFKSMIIATDSEYVALGATEWVRGWKKREWVTSYGKPVKNKDLWQCLLGEIERWADSGFKIQFWRIPREQNSMADGLAKQAAEKGEEAVEFTDFRGIIASLC